MEHSSRRQLSLWLIPCKFQWESQKMRRRNYTNIFPAFFSSSQWSCPNQHPYLPPHSPFTNASSTQCPAVLSHHKSDYGYLLPKPFGWPLRPPTYKLQTPLRSDLDPGICPVDPPGNASSIYLPILSWNPQTPSSRPCPVFCPMLAPGPGWPAIHSEDFHSHLQDLFNCHHFLSSHSFHKHLLIINIY